MNSPIDTAVLADAIVRAVTHESNVTAEHNLNLFNPGFIVVSSAFK